MAKTATQKKFVKQTALMNQKKLKKLVEQADRAGKSSLSKKAGGGSGKAGRGFGQAAGSLSQALFKAGIPLGARRGALAGALILAAGASPALAAFVQRGNLSCDDPQDAYEQLSIHDASDKRAGDHGPDYANLSVEAGMCRLAEGKDALGLNNLENAVELGIPYAALLIAKYYLTEGTFEEARFFQKNLLRVIRHFEQVWAMVSGPYYPYDRPPIQELDEKGQMIKLQMPFEISQLYFYRHFRAVVEDNNSRRARSLSWPAGEKRPVSYHPEDLGAAKDSLQKMFRWASTCKQIPYDPNLWSRSNYDHIMRDCGVLREAAEKMIPLDQQRREAARRCDDILKCPDYDEILGQMGGLDSETKGGWRNRGEMIKAGSSFRLIFKKF